MCNGIYKNLLHSYIVAKFWLSKREWQCGGVTGVGVGQTALPLPDRYYGNQKYIVISKKDIIDLKLEKLWF